MQARIRLEIYLTAAMLVATNLGCSKVQFSSDSASSVAQSAGPVVAPPVDTHTDNQPVTNPPDHAIGSETCTPIPPSNRLTKILFLVDSSGSNDLPSTPAVGASYGCALGGPAPCIAPTDPQKAFRLGSIQRYFNRYQGSANFQWSFISFGGDSAVGYMPRGRYGSAFSANPLDMQAAINAFARIADDGATPMSAALQLAAQTIANDPDRLTAKNPQYVTVLLTDGYPSDYQSSTDAAVDVQDLLAAASGESSLSTIYYGSQDSISSAAIGFLSDLARTGGGQFANVNNPQSGLDIQTVIPGQPCN